MTDIFLSNFPKPELTPTYPPDPKLSCEPSEMVEGVDSVGKLASCCSQLTEETRFLAYKLEKEAATSVKLRVSKLASTSFSGFEELTAAQDSSAPLVVPALEIAELAGEFLKLAAVVKESTLIDRLRVEASKLVLLSEDYLSDAKKKDSASILAVEVMDSLEIDSQAQIILTECRYELEVVGPPESNTPYLEELPLPVRVARERVLPTSPAPMELFSKRSG